MLYGEFGEDQSKTLPIGLFCVLKKPKMVFWPGKLMELKKTWYAYTI